MMKNYLSLLLIVGLISACGAPESRKQISLAGSWGFRTDPEGVGEEEAWFVRVLDDSVELPGTMDTNRKGEPNTDLEETTYLSREYRYVGKAWYQKQVDIPSDWEGHVVELRLERTRATKVWLDDTYMGASDFISGQQVYDLSSWLTPGQHTLTIQVDNGEALPPQILDNSHACTESTQTNWNGIIGEIVLEAKPVYHFRDIQAYTSPQTSTVRVELDIHTPAGEGLPSGTTVSLDIQSFNTDKKHRVRVSHPVVAAAGKMSIEIPMGSAMLLWSEFDPALYRLTATLEGKGVYDRESIVFGIREFAAKDTQFTINGLTTFLRGKHDACVFPLTGHTAMDVETWTDYFRTARAYGINHYRFHSWCPPRACFEAADREGIYLQPELSFWGALQKEDSLLYDFLLREGIEIQKQYSNYVSFVMFAIGNELWGEQEDMKEMIAQFRAMDQRHLYATGSNNFLGYMGPAEGDDYFTTCRVPGENIYANHTRGSFSFVDAEEGGYINHTYPNSEMNFRTAVEQCSIPVISHETGQFQIYPDYREIDKYTGVLKPRNYEVFKKRLEEAGMADQAHDFFLASGKWAVELYRADIEMGLRTPGLAGFQLLDLQDYPGQGSAFVGVLDAFMESKGLVTPAEWRQFCSEVVPLFVTPKFCYTTNETLSGTVEIANYSSGAITDTSLNWTLTDPDDTVLDGGSWELRIPQGTLAPVGDLLSDLSGIKDAVKLTLRLDIPGTPYHNQYPLWVYPQSICVKDTENNIHIAHRLDDSMITRLSEGGKVLWFPSLENYTEVTVGGLFQTDYWNYRMFRSIAEWAGKPVSPGTLGLLMDPGHPVFRTFPTDRHTNWQWYPMVKQSRPLILDRLPAGYKPLIQVIDNVERNHKLGFLFEFRIGEGSLLICMSDLAAVSEYPEARQLYGALLDYMVSEDFQPGWELSVTELEELFSQPVETNRIRTLGNISYEDE
ncbi:MAG: beta-glycosidase [Bacteroides sp.]|nr:beta-glycosidase [Bacteroides sp.]